MISSFSFPVPIRSGEGALRLLQPQLSQWGVRRPLIVTDRGLLATPAFTALHAEITSQTEVFSDVRPNPTAEDVEACITVFKNAACDAVIGFGGGSALDVAKVIRAGLADTGKHWSEVTWEDDLPPLIPFIAIPTTAGTGSEVGRSSVITFDQTKRVIFHPALLAKLILLDPTATAGLPPALTAATGADALTHCIEAYTSPVYHPLCDGIALEGLRIVFSSLPRCVEEGSDLAARSQMQVAAAMGGIAFQKDLGAAHSLSHPLSAHFGIHHGLANAICLPHVMRFNAARKPGVYAGIARALDLPGRSDEEAIAAVEGLLVRIGIAGGLAAKGVADASLDLLADAAFADSCHQTNPVPVTRDDLRALYAAAL